MWCAATWLYAVRMPTDGLLHAQAGDMIRDGNQKYVSKDLMAALKLYEEVLEEVRAAAGGNPRGPRVCSTWRGYGGETVDLPLFAGCGMVLQSRATWSVCAAHLLVHCSRAQSSAGSTILSFYMLAAPKHRQDVRTNTACWPLLSPAEGCHRAAAAGSVVRRHSCACCLW